jgi:hypothetical protein
MGSSNNALEKFVRLHRVKAEEYLRKQRIGLRAGIENEIATLVVLEFETALRVEGDEEADELHDALQAFVEAFVASVVGTGGLVPVSPQAIQPGAEDLVLVGWFAKDLAGAIRAAREIRSAFQKTPFAYKALLRVAVGKHDYAASRIVGWCDDDRILVDPDLWAKVEKIERKSLETQGVVSLDVKTIRSTFDQEANERLARSLEKTT